MIALLSAAVFVWIEQRARQPILPLSFFKNRNYALMTTVTLLFGAGFMGSILYLTQFNQQVFGADATGAGLMLLTMVGGMMVSSITTGQIVSRIGRYKRFIITGFTLASLSIFALITLQPDSPYWHEAIIMAFCGLGLGMAMPILSLAVQNEFEHKDLGAATSSVQLFRGLGSTVGTAIFSGMLTMGILSAVGTPADMPFIQTLKQSPASAQMLSGDIDADVLLQINGQSATIRDQANAAFAKIPNETYRTMAKEDFTKKQDEFTKSIIDAFTKSLHRIFLVASGIMAIGLITVLFIENKQLKDGVKATPGE
jgi:MFS family permease